MVCVECSKHIFEITDNRVYAFQRREAWWHINRVFDIQDL